MHVIHAVDHVVTESDREDGDKVSPVAQKELRFEGVHSAQELGEHVGDPLLPFKGDGSDRAAEGDVVRHVGLGSFDVAPAHGFEVRVEVLGVNHPD